MRRHFSSRQKVAKQQQKTALSAPPLPQDMCLYSAAIVLLVSLVLPRLLACRRSKAAAAKKPNRPNFAHCPTDCAVLITGGGRGIGKACSDHLLSLGYHVFVTVRVQSQYDELSEKVKISGTGPHPVLMDVSNDKYTAHAVERVRALLQVLNCKLIAVVNNAGINPEAEQMARAYAKDDTPENVLSDPDVAAHVFQTNVVGVARVTKAFLPLILDGGRICNIGSYFGSIAGQAGLCHAYYESAKFALEGLSDNMRRSLLSEGIYVSLIKPGNISTDMNSFGESSALVVAKDVEHAISSTRPKSRYFPGKVKGLPVRLVCLIFEMMPTWITDAM